MVDNARFHRRGNAQRLMSSGAGGDHHEQANSEGADGGGQDEGADAKSGVNLDEDFSPGRAQFDAGERRIADRIAMAEGREKS